MNRIRRLLLVSVLGLAVAASSAAGLRAQETENGSSPDTAAVAINTRDGSTVFRVAFMIFPNPRDVVDNTNIAFAFSSCEACKTIAVSFQVVLVTGDPSVVTPENFAIAINFECTDCQTLASAYQWVLSTGGQVTFTPEGREEIAQIRKELRLLMSTAESLTVFEIQEQIDALALRLAEVLANELVVLGPRDLRLEVRQDDVDEGVEPGEPTETPSVETGTSPPSGTDSPAPTETGSPTETVSVSPSPTSTG